MLLPAFKPHSRNVMQRGSHESVEKRLSNPSNTPRVAFSPKKRRLIQRIHRQFRKNQTGSQLLIIRVHNRRTRPILRQRHIGEPWHSIVSRKNPLQLWFTSTGQTDVEFVLGKVRPALQFDQEIDLILKSSRGN